MIRLGIFHENLISNNNCFKGSGMKIWISANQSSALTILNALYSSLRAKICPS